LKSVSLTLQLKQRETLQGHIIMIVLLYARGVKYFDNP
jgi:hypothetical protein